MFEVEKCIFDRVFKSPLPHLVHRAHFARHRTAFPATFDPAHPSTGVLLESVKTHGLTWNQPFHVVGNSDAGWISVFGVACVRTVVTTTVRLEYTVRAVREIELDPPNIVVTQPFRLSNLCDSFSSNVHIRWFYELMLG